MAFDSELREHVVQGGSVVVHGSPADARRGVLRLLRGRRPESCVIALPAEHGIGVLTVSKLDGEGLDALCGTMRDALRIDPDVIVALVPRDWSEVVTAVETGHQVLVAASLLGCDEQSEGLRRMGVRFIPASDL